MKRIATALVLVPASVAVVLYGPPWALLAALALVGAAAWREFDRMVAAHGIPRAGWPALALGMALLLVPERMALAALVLAAAVLTTSALRVADLSGAITSAAAGLLGVVYIFGALRSAAELRAMNAHWLMVALLVNWAGDTAAFYTGRALGRRKLALRISPAKTWEGAAGSLAGGILAASLYAHYRMPASALWAVLLIAAAANMAGQVGDVAESAWKRGAGLKDSGSSLPGHGGWLDRIDSSLFSIPVVYAILLLAG